MTKRIHETIELGGGDNPVVHPNLDIQPSPAVDTVCDLTQGIPLEDNSVKTIYSKDFIEHISFEQFLSLLSECKRVLVDNGMLDFIIPDTEQVISNHNEWNEHVSNVVVGRWEPDNRKHRAWYSTSLIKYILEKEGWQCETYPYNEDADGCKEPKFVLWAMRRR